MTVLEVKAFMAIFEHLSYHLLLAYFHATSVPVVKDLISE